MRGLASTWVGRRGRVVSLNRATSPPALIIGLERGSKRETVSPNAISPTCLVFSGILNPCPRGPRKVRVSPGCQWKGMGGAAVKEEIGSPWSSAGWSPGKREKAVTASRSVMLCAWRYCPGLGMDCLGHEMTARRPRSSPSSIFDIVPEKRFTPA